MAGPLSVFFLVFEVGFSGQPGITNIKQHFSSARPNTILQSNVLDIEIQDLDIEIWDGNCLVSLLIPTADAPLVYFTPRGCRRSTYSVVRTAASPALRTLAVLVC